MANAKKCDRCGVFFQDGDFKEYYEYEIATVGMFHPIVKDLCPDCKRALNEWYKNQPCKTGCLYRDAVKAMAEYSSNGYGCPRADKKRWWKK